MMIRVERESDITSVHAVHEAAFPTSSEAFLVDGLRRMADPIVSLVAEERGRVVGHILFTPVSLDGWPDLVIMGLAPMAVLPGHQRAGIGSAMVRAGLDQCRLLSVSAIVVLGHPEFYPRFGFLPSTRFDIRSEYDVPEDVFMALELDPGSLAGVSGTVRYHDAFNAVA
jgi:putative acetyltransferase